MEVGRDDCNAGIWLGQEKLVDIGLAVKRGVTMHGFTFNVNTNLRHFDYIVPCGLTDKTVTSIENILGEKQDLNEIMNDIVACFKDVYGFEV